MNVVKQQRSLATKAFYKLHSVMAPSTEAEAADMLRTALTSGNRLRVSSQSASPAEQLDQDVARLCSQNLTGIVHHDVDDFVVTVRAGTPISVLAAALAARGQRLTFDPPHRQLRSGQQRSCTAGVVAACALSGLGRLAGSAARDQILGLRLIDGRGQIVRCGARASKNVAGFDLTRLVVGSRGSLGLITELSFKLEALPAARQTIAWSGTPSDLLQRLAQARSQGLQVTAGVHACANTALAIGVPPSSGGMNIVRFDGRSASVRAHAVHFVTLLTRDRLDLPQDVADRMWNGLRDLDAFAASPIGRVWHGGIAHDEVLDSVRRVADMSQACMQIDGCAQRAWLSLPHGAAYPEPAAPPRPSLHIAQLTRSLRHSFDPHGVFEAADRTTAPTWDHRENQIQP